MNERDSENIAAMFAERGWELTDDEDAADIARRCAGHRGKDAVICALPEHFDLGKVLRHLLTALAVRKPLCAGIFSASAVRPYFKGGGVCILFSMEQTSA